MTLCDAAKYGLWSATRINARLVLGAAWLTECGMSHFGIRLAPVEMQLTFCDMTKYGLWPDILSRRMRGLGTVWLT